MILKLTNKLFIPTSMLLLAVSLLPAEVSAKVGGIRFDGACSFYCSPHSHPDSCGDYDSVTNDTNGTAHCTTSAENSMGCLAIATSQCQGIDNVGGSDFNLYIQNVVTPELETLSGNEIIKWIKSRKKGVDHD